MAQATRKGSPAVPFSVRLKAAAPFIAALLLLIGATLLVMALQQRYRNSDSWQLQRVRVAGELRQVKSAEVLAAMQVRSGMTLAALELITLHQKVVALPWVKSASLRRVYPGELHVQITERTPWLRLNADQLVDVDGVPFAPANVAAFAQLPQLRTTSTQLARAIGEFRTGNDALYGLGLRITELELNGRGSLTLVLDNGMQLLFGRDDWEGRRQRLLQLYPELVADGVVPRYVDLRYDTGFAVAWPEPVAPPGRTPAVKTAGL